MAQYSGSSVPHPTGTTRDSNAGNSPPSRVNTTPSASTRHASLGSSRSPSTISAGTTLRSWVSSVMLCVDLADPTASAADPPASPTWTRDRPPQAVHPLQGGQQLMGGLRRTSVAAGVLRQVINDPERIQRCLRRRNTRPSSRSSRSVSCSSTSRLDESRYAACAASRPEAEREGGDALQLGEDRDAEAVEAGGAAGSVEELKAQLAEVRKENRELARANQILQDAAAFFGAALDRRSQK